MKLKLLAAAKSANINSLLFPHITTLQDWITQQNTPQQTLISETNKQLLLVEAIRHSPGLFQTNNAWPLAKELVSLFNECTLAMVPLNNGEQALREILHESYEFPINNIENISRESEIVYQLWQAYREQIQARKWLDPIDHYCQSLVNYQSNDAALNYYAVGKHRFSVAEILFFHSLAKSNALSLYSPKVSRNQFGTHHHPHLRTIKTDAVSSINNIREQALDIIYDQRDHTFERIQQLKQTYPDNVLKNWLSIYTCHSIEHHVSAVCLQAKKWLLEDKQPIGIVVNDRLLARRIRAVLEEEGIRPTDLGGWTLSTTSAATSIEILLDAIECNFKKESLLDLLSSPFLSFHSDQESNYQHQLNQIKKSFKKTSQHTNRQH